ncbi:EscU/YscU/HrcU family type III secretion system export apparatus switch protein [Nocardioides marmoribigeumensis]|uniref:Flagellar biosynthetic protein FlhB n=1 Tax=Nocardioides marmoribigeumensis TaxID=433649 RepID=A0ABU2BTY2_9ACTN|nr:EscU/YscU/HrcU family type III secretion system export apparatus switch protein [Nocardioides marmoribigeumensis]MDR7362087.1 flagellar biosynthetic protein FlhB [Nocardioides marmoribigeumensis]
MSGGGGEKTEKPTAKRRKEARKEGQVARTPDLGGYATLLVFSMVAGLAAKHEGVAIMELMQRALRLVAEPDEGKAVALLGDSLRHTMTVICVLGGVVMVIGVASALAQGGFFVATKLVTPKWSKLDPIKGAKKVFGPHSVWELAKVLLKSTVIALICWSAIKAVMPLLGGLVPMSASLTLVSDRAIGLLRTVAFAGLLMAAADYAFQRRRVGKQTRMSKEELKQEAKQTEGDPLVKSAIRSRQLAAARSRMMKDVATADVVLVNPTHVAVALRYDPDRGAPLVVARGAGAIAAKIRERAQESDVPLVHDVPLARALYGGCQVGQQIPAELFAAVAQVLAFVISRRATGTRGGTYESPRPDPEVPDVKRVRRRRRR